MAARSAPARRGAQAAPRGARRPIGPLTREEALLGFLIAAMDANGHVSREELTRAHHLISSTRTFRRMPCDALGRCIDKMRTRVEQHGAIDVLEAGARSIPRRLRPSAFALATDLVLADGKIDRSEQQFLDRLASDLQLDRGTALGVRDVMLVKNRA